MLEGGALSRERQGEDDGTDEDNDNNAHSFVVEWDELESLLSSWHKLTTPSERERRTARAVKIVHIRKLEKYQENPTLLDVHVKHIVQTLVGELRGHLAQGQGGLHHANCISRVIYTVAKIRGYKIVLKFFPHETVDVEATLSAAVQHHQLKVASTEVPNTHRPLEEGLSEINSPLQTVSIEEIPTNYSSWETRYIILLWLSVRPFIHTVLNIGKECVCDIGRTSEGAVILLGNILTRPDTQKSLQEFMCWSEQKMNSAISHERLGILATIAVIFKQGPRLELLPYSQNILHLGARGLKLVTKLVQRIALVFLKPKVATWRYNRGLRSLTSTLQTSAVATETNAPNSEEVEEIPVPPEVESIIGLLLKNLKHKSTIVRWSAAKGLGRITGRLPISLADEVVAAVIELFSPHEQDSSWHGGYLCLGELTRRCLLLPERLPAVIPLVVQGLTYDQPRGSYSIGTHVRDAACFVCWSFARAYSKAVMAPYITQVAQSLVITALFDREINCRRAASAAFQEHVGRQGSFPHGLEIIALADYMTLGNRTEAFTTVAFSIAQFEEYRIQIIEHLLKVKLKHWDPVIRELAAKSIGRISTVASQIILDQYLPAIVPQCLALDVFSRHGNLLALAEIVTSLQLTYPEKLLQDILDIIPQIEDARLYRGRGTEVLRATVCRLIEAISHAHFPLQRKEEVPVQPVMRAPSRGLLGIKAIGRPRVYVFQDVIDDCLVQPYDFVQDSAVRALQAFSKQYYVRSGAICSPKTVEKAVTKYVKQLSTEPNPAVRRGAALALGVFPEEILAVHISKILSALMTATRTPEVKDMYDPETRRNAICAVSKLNKIGRKHLTSEMQSAILECYILACGDYSIDSRGDVGSWVREASLISIGDFVEVHSDGLQSWVNDAKMASVLGEILLQMGQKLDKLRLSAARVLVRLVNVVETRWNIPDLSAVQAVKKVPLDDSVQLFSFLASLLHYDSWRAPVLCGLIPTIGGITKSLSDHAFEAVIKYLRTGDQLSNEQSLSLTLLMLFEKNLACSRITVPLMKTVGMLLNSGFFASLQPPDNLFSVEIFRLAQKETRKSTDIQKLSVALYLFAGLLTFKEPTRTRSLKHLISMLVHPYPKIRCKAAEHMYTKLLVCGESIPHPALGSEAFLSLLSSPWDGTPEEVSLKQGQVCKILCIPVPEPITLPETSPPRSSTSSGGYIDLVQEAGY
ncbi:beta-tubulin cofactor D [Pelomyxa schiedti]|nr:beta-tubulin cofactor D [Pelomyxa schiedti]